MSPPVNLVTLRPGVTLEAAAAASFQRVEKRAGRLVDVNSSYRDWDEQMGHYLAFLRDPKNNPIALHPDKSMHCKGLAIDSDDHTLMRAAGDFGWRATVASEPWHFDYFRHLDKHYGAPAGGDSKPLPTPPAPAPTDEEDDMDRCRIIYRGDPAYGAEWSLIGASIPGGRRVTKSQATANAWAVLYGSALVIAKRDDYVKLQAEAAALHTSWLAQQKLIAKG